MKKQLHKAKMKNLKKLLPTEDRIIDVGWNDDGRLVLCFKYFEGAEQYDGCFPFAFFNPPLVTLDDLENEIVKHFGTDHLPPDDLEDLGGIDILKCIIVTRFENTAK